jgi:protocatechuate 3,4-dioxygenase beta subunit
MRLPASAIVLLSAVALHGQTPGPSSVSTGSIRGRALAAATNAPLRNARIELENAARNVVSTVLADDEGRFTLTGISAGVYTLAVAKPGYVKTRFTADGDGRTYRSPIRVAAGATLESLDVRLPKAGAITGRILDGLGEPIMGVAVTAGSVGDGVQTSADGETDDLGEYRIGGLPAGRFIVAVSVPAGVLVSQPTVIAAKARGPGRIRLYFPGTNDFSQAQPVEVLASEERSNIDFGVPFTQLTNDVTLGDVHLAGDVTVIGNGGALVAVPGFGNGRPPERDATGEISGRVLRTDGHPLARAQVSLELADAVRTGRGTLTDDDGRYDFKALRPGDYTVRASKRGYLDVEYGQSRALERGDEIKLSAGGKRERADISLPRYGTIAGHVLDENGEPVEGARVSVLQRRFAGGRPGLVEAQAAIKWTDDLGSFRVHDLQPGRYVVRASLGDSDPPRPRLDVPGYVATYFPGTQKPAEARLVTVGVSEDVSGMDFAMVRLRTARISGHAFTSSGEYIKGGLSLTPSQRSGSVTSMPVGPHRMFAPDASFEFSNVPPGEYVIQATMGRSSFTSEGEFAAQYVFVDGDNIDGLVIRTAPGSTISGRLTFEGGDLPGSREIGLTPEPVDADLSPRFNRVGPFGEGPPGRADVHGDWTFEIAGISGPRRLRLSDPPAGWALKGIYLDGVEVTDRIFMFGTNDQSLRDLQVVLTTQMTVIEGTTSDARGRPARDCLVVAFPVDRELRSYPSRFMDRSVCQRDGSFIVRRLPAAEYFIAAIGRRSNDGPDDWQDPERLEAIARSATRVMLAEGQRLPLSLHVNGP